MVSYFPFLFPGGFGGGGLVGRTTFIGTGGAAPFRDRPIDPPGINCDGGGDPLRLRLSSFSEDLSR